MWKKFFFYSSGRRVNQDSRMFHQLNRALEDQQVTTLEKFLEMLQELKEMEHWGDMYTRVNMRGSRAAAFMNGVNVTSNWGPLSEDMSYVDHIEFVKGPSGFLMSNGEPSGIYNIVTKNRQDSL
jgi:iron complex outermembrane receptor protein